MGLLLLVVTCRVRTVALAIVRQAALVECRLGPVRDHVSTVSSVVSMFALLANIFVYSYWAYGHSHASFVQQDPNDSRSMVQSLVSTVIVVSLLVALTAMLLGLVAGTYFGSPGFHGWCNRLGTASGLALVVCLLVLSAGTHDNVAWWDQPWCLSTWRHGYPRARVGSGRVALPGVVGPGT
jgi:ABC-type phosphate transport system permease subunit